MPSVISEKTPLTDPRSAYQMISLLEGVVQRGTGWRAKYLKKPLGGKTGTTNDSNDAWFVGFSSDLVFGVWVGYDIPKSLGENETGSSVTVPIFIDFMKKALRETPARPFKVPEDIKFAKIDRHNATIPGPNSLKKDIIYEAFKSENYDEFIKQQKQIKSAPEEDNTEGLQYESEIY